MHCGYVVKVEQLRKHNNADRLQIATFFGNDTVVDLSVKVGDLGVYFPVDLQLSEEYCNQNNLVRKKDENGNNVGGFLDPDKRNIRAIKLRGEKSDGLFMPLTSFSYCSNVPLALNVGDQITILNKHEICKKYIPKTTDKTGSPTTGNRTRVTKEPYAPLFAEHADTEQLAYNLGAFRAGDEIEITLKMHGTSQRTGYLPVLKGYKKTLLQRLFKKPGTPVYEYDYVSGTRRVVMEDFEDGSGFYGGNQFREQHHNTFVGKLNKGETVYYEVVGFTHTGTPIMADGSNKNLDKEFIKQYGETTRFSYGCCPTGVDTKYGCDDSGYFVLETPLPQSDLYVYRMTMTNEDGFVVEYTPDFMRYRCEQMGVKTVPVFARGIITTNQIHLTTTDGRDIDYVRNIQENILEIANMYVGGPDPVGKTHIREGVVVRIINKPKFCAYKHKNFEFRVIEGLIKDVATAPDMEEAQDG